MRRKPLRQGAEAVIVLRQFPRLSLTIKREMFFLSVLSFLLVSLSVSGIFLKLLYDERVRSARTSLRECNSQIVTFTEGLFRENAAMIQLLATDDMILHAGYGDEEALLSRFDVVLKSNENLTYVYAGYEDGSLHIRDYNTPEDYNVKERPWYQAAMETDGVARLVYSDAATGVWLFSQCMKLTDGKGVIAGALSMDFSNASITRQLSSKYRYDSQRSFIIDAGGTVLVHPADARINRSLREYVGDENWNAVISGGNYVEYTIDGVKAMAYLERVPETSFIVVTAIDASEVTAPIGRNVAVLLGVMALVSLALGLAMSRLFIRRFAQPLRELSGRIRNLAAGTPELGNTLGTSNAEMQSIAQDIEIIVKDIANREEERKAAEYLSFHDSMTGIYNRRFFEEELKRLDTTRNYPLCFLCCDVNGLKLVNDVFGHALGDKLLLTVASCLQQSMRMDDVLARVGGDEFSIILPRTDEDGVQQIVRRIQSALPTESLCGAQVSVSMGYAFKTEAAQSIGDILHRADEMMYDRKMLESVQMKQHTVHNIIAAAEREGLVCPLNEREQSLLQFFSAQLCPESEALLFESFRLRRLGLCSLLFSMGGNAMTLRTRHTETGYRILSSLEEYRAAAAYVLHYREHWDGSGWPSGLAGPDIPLLSRIIAVAEAYLEQGLDHLAQNSGVWYDDQLVALLREWDA